MAMTNNNDDIEDDIFDKHMNEIDERETPRWELSEEEMEESKAPQLMPHVSANQTLNMATAVDLPVFNGAHGHVALPAGLVKSGKQPVTDNRSLSKNYPLAIQKNGVQLPATMTSTNTDLLKNGFNHNDFETDSVKDFGGAFREKEAKYMERTSEAIYNRAVAEHIRQPNPYEDDDQYSIKHFGGASQGISRLPSDENLCLSPPWLEEEDGQIPDVAARILAESKENKMENKKNFKMYDILAKATSKADYGTNFYQVEETLDFTKDFGKLENSSRPSSENISLTPPWEETDRESSCKNEETVTTSPEKAVELPAVPTTGVASPRPLTTTVMTTTQPSNVPVAVVSKPGRYQDNSKSGSALTTCAASVVTLPGNVPRRVTPPANTTACVGNTREVSPAALINYGYQAPYRPHYPPADYYPPPRAPVPRGLLQPARYMPANVRPYPSGTMDFGQVPPTRTRFPPEPAGYYPRAPMYGASRVGGAYEMPHQAARQVHDQAAWAYMPYRTEPAMFGSGQQRQSYAENVMSDSDVSPVMSTRCDSESSLAVYCYTPRRDGLETASVMSFASGPSTHQELDSKIEQVKNLLAVIEGPKELAQTLHSLSNSKDNCEAMRQCGCLPLLVKLQHRVKLAALSDDARAAHEIRVRSAQAMRNIATSSVEDKRGRRELRVLKLLEMIRSYCIQERFSRKATVKARVLEQALAAIMKLSFEEDHRTAIGQLGGVEAIGEFLELAHARDSHTTGDEGLEPTSGGGVDGQRTTPEPSLCKYASMALTNMTFGNTRNKRILGNAPGIIRAILSDLKVLTDEDLIQVSASVLRNLSCKPDEATKKVFRECGACAALVTAGQHVKGEPALRTILLAVWNLSAHCSANKTELCDTVNSLAFLVQTMAYKSPTNSLSVVESAGGILRNLSSHVAVKAEYRAILRQNDCFPLLLAHLRSPSLRVVSNACGILWNLSARCVEDQALLWRLNAVPLLKNLVSSKHKTIAKGAGAALKNLQNYKPPASQFRDSPSTARKPSGSPRTRPEFAATRTESLNSFTGSLEDVMKEGVRKTSKIDMDGENRRAPKGVRWAVDDRRKGNGRKTSSTERRKQDAPESPDESTSFLVSGHPPDDAMAEVTSAMAKSCLATAKKGERSPKNKKKANAKRATDDDIHESALVNGVRAQSSSSNARRADGQQRVPAEETSGEEGSPRGGRSSAKNVRKKSSDENGDEKGGGHKKIPDNFVAQRCQCPEESGIWVKRSKKCERCQRRRMSHSSESAAGSQRSSCESLPNTSRTAARNESTTGCVTTL